MPINRTLLCYCCNSLKDRRIWVSASLSALLWIIPLLILDFFTSGSTLDGLRSFWDKTPLGFVVALAVMLLIALGMHLIFLRRVQRLSGKSFWLFPFTSLTVATLILASVVIGAGFFHELWYGGIQLRLIMAPIYLWLGALFVVFFHIWLTYPLAIINQIIVQKVFGITRG